MSEMTVGEAPEELSRWRRFQGGGGCSPLAGDFGDAHQMQLWRPGWRGDAPWGRTRAGSVVVDGNLSEVQLGLGVELLLPPLLWLHRRRHRMRV